jgi:hypothetical protein
MVIGRYPLTQHQSTQINGQERTDSFTITTNKQQKVHELPEIQIVRQITSIICFFRTWHLTCSVENMSRTYS